MILQIIEEELACPIVDPDKDFSELGVDSLEVMSMLKAVEEAYQIKFTRDEAFGFRTPRDVMDNIRARME